jgi:hypothetical protein
VGCTCSCATIRKISDPSWQAFFTAFSSTWGTEKYGAPTLSPGHGYTLISAFFLATEDSSLP